MSLVKPLSLSVILLFNATIYSQDFSYPGPGENPWYNVYTDHYYSYNTSNRGQHPNILESLDVRFLKVLGVKINNKNYFIISENIAEKQDALYLKLLKALTSSDQISLRSTNNYKILFLVLLEKDANNNVINVIDPDKVEGESSKNLTEFYKLISKDGTFKGFYFAGVRYKDKALLPIQELNNVHEQTLNHSASMADIAMASTNNVDQAISDAKFILDNYEKAMTIFPSLNTRGWQLLKPYLVGLISKEFESSNNKLDEIKKLSSDVDYNIARIFFITDLKNTFIKAEGTYTIFKYNNILPLLDGYMTIEAGNKSNGMNEQDTKSFVIDRFFGGLITSQERNSRIMEKFISDLKLKKSVITEPVAELLFRYGLYNELPTDAMKYIAELMYLPENEAILNKYSAIYADIIKTLEDIKKVNNINTPKEILAKLKEIDPTTIDVNLGLAILEKAVNIVDENIDTKERETCLNIQKQIIPIGLTIREERKKTAAQEQRYKDINFADFYDRTNRTGNEPLMKEAKSSLTDIISSKELTMKNVKDLFEGKDCIASKIIQEYNKDATSSYNKLQILLLDGLLTKTKELAYIQANYDLIKEIRFDNSKTHHSDNYSFLNKDASSYRELMDAKEAITKSLNRMETKDIKALEEQKRSIKELKLVRKI